jgi:glycerol-1-phosphate dehydrogenase [NAD(P)+]
MNADIIRRDGRLELKNLSCDCSFTHEMPEMDIYIRPGLVTGCGPCIREAGLGNHVLIIADSVTLAMAGQTIKDCLENDGFECELCLLPGDKIEPTPEMAEYIMARISPKTEFLLSVGSGVITDLTRRSSFLSKLPFAAFGTAASMDGYTSITSSMMIGNAKVSVYGCAARLLMFDTQILAAAPKLMTAAGLGDMLAKYNVLVDWKLGSVVAGEVFCPLCAHLLTTALDRCRDTMDDILASTQAGQEALIEALILAGLTVLIVGYTRTVSSVEHNMSHFWEMRSLAYGTPAPSHGISVGIGLIYSLLYHKMLGEADLSRIDKKAVKAARMTKEQKLQYLIENYPPGVPDEIMSVNEDWYISWEEQERRIDALTAYHEAYKKDCAILPDYRDIARYLAHFGAPTSASKAGIDRETLKKTLTVTAFFRKRYSISAALSELGLLDAFADRILDMEDSL